MDKKVKIFYIPKKKGYRKIVTYDKDDSFLRSYHENANKLMYNRILQSKFAKAFTKGRSIIQNAKAHMYNDVFLFYDIKDFFPSVNHNKLIDKLYYEINLNKKRLVPKSECVEIVKSSSISNKGLAQGLITSPFLSNLYLKDFDNILYGNIKKLGLNNIIYTRYADDMVISFKKDTAKITPQNINLVSKKIMSLVEEKLKNYGLRLNKSKIHKVDIHKSNHVKITGINIVRREDNYRDLTVGRRRKDELYYETIKIMQQINNSTDSEKALWAKGMLSFILSVEGDNFENVYSTKMKEHIKSYGVSSLKELITKKM